LRQNTLSVNRCVLFRVKDWGSLAPNPGSGAAVFTTFSGTKNPALVGFVSFGQESLDEALPQEVFDGKDMDDSSFSHQIHLANVAFFGAWKLPSKLSKDYEIVCVPGIADSTGTEETQM
jgi:hypothetical protein